MLLLTAPPWVRVSSCWAASESRSRRTVAAETASRLAASLDADVPVGGQQLEQLVQPLVLRHRAGSRYLTEPAVSPPTRYFSITANRMTTGTIAMSEAANSWSQCWE